jgi:glycerophosphoryl diester phosphodiesterase
MSLFAAAALLAGCAPKESTAMTEAPASRADRPLIIAHRGASGERPEHTLAAYELAIDQGADFIEPDLVITKDGVLVARHENEIGGTTDVAARPEYVARQTTKTIDGAAVTGWFTEDFTLAELKTLRARERLPELRSTAHDGQFDIPTLAEVIALAKARGVGIYPETKHPSYFRELGLPLEPPLLAALEQAGWTTADAPVFIQSFEVQNLMDMASQTDVRLVQLVGNPMDPSPLDESGVSYADMMTPTGLAAVADYAAGIGPNTALIDPADQSDTAFLKRAQTAGLAVHAWTFRRENAFLPEPFQSGAPGEAGNLTGFACTYIRAGIDGLFTDNVAEVVAAVERCAEQTPLDSSP